MPGPSALGDLRLSALGILGTAALSDLYLSAQATKSLIPPAPRFRSVQRQDFLWGIVFSGDLCEGG